MLKGTTRRTSIYDVYFYNSLGCDYNLVFSKLDGELIVYEVRASNLNYRADDDRRNPGVSGLPSKFEEYKYYIGDSLGFRKKGKYQSLKWNYWT